MGGKVSHVFWDGRAMSAKCSGMGRPDPPRVPGQAGDVRHVSRDGWASPPRVSGWAGDVPHVSCYGQAGRAMSAKCPVRGGPGRYGSREGQAMSATCTETGRPGLPLVPGRPGDVCHISRDGRAGPATGPGMDR
ncbi:collagen alpha-1(XII) chain-like [Macrobrachium nipponense]|uniref:collagen alpha-1(XII) chain-like n=1 Tax=Macrobrachium nipponense TaxID=159736 RepID=UPI0030C7CA8A